MHKWMAFEYNEIRNLFTWIKLVENKIGRAYHDQLFRWPISIPWSVSAVQEPTALDSSCQTGCRTGCFTVGGGIFSWGKRSDFWTDFTRFHDAIITDLWNEAKKATHFCCILSFRNCRKCYLKIMLKSNIICLRACHCYRLLWWFRQRRQSLSSSVAAVRKVVGSTLTADRAVFWDLILGL